MCRALYKYFNHGSFDSTGEHILRHDMEVIGNRTSCETEHCLMPYCAEAGHEQVIFSITILDHNLIGYICLLHVRTKEAMKVLPIAYRGSKIP